MHYPRVLFLWLAVAVAVTAEALATAQAPQHHRLAASARTVVVGGYGAGIPPVLTIASGDSVELDLAFDVTRLEEWGVPTEWIRPESRGLDLSLVKERGPGGHTLVGPIYIDGAEPRDVLEVRIQRVEVLDRFAINVSTRSGALAPYFPYQHVKVVPIDLTANVARFAPGVEVPIRPFFGSMGLAPPRSAGRISSGPPGYHGGNFDNRDLVAGAVLYLPVHVRGALFSAGDGHAAQGHGEVNGTAIEAALKGVFQFVVRKDVRLTWPRAETPTHYMTMGFDEDLDEAARIATREMVMFLVERMKLSHDDSYALASGAADLHVTQVVDGVKGVHVMIPKNIFRTP
jgi:acetamidase/formamidase